MGFNIHVHPRHLFSDLRSFLILYLVFLFSFNLHLFILLLSFFSFFSIVCPVISIIFDVHPSLSAILSRPFPTFLPHFLPFSLFQSSGVNKKRRGHMPLSDGEKKGGRENEGERAGQNKSDDFTMDLPPSPSQQSSSSQFNHQCRPYNITPPPHTHTPFNGLLLATPLSGSMPNVRPETAHKK